MITHRESSKAIAWNRMHQKSRHRVDDLGQEKEVQNMLGEHFGSASVKFLGPRVGNV